VTGAVKEKQRNAMHSNGNVRLSNEERWSSLETKGNGNAWSGSEEYIS
jgi:hypothetical protein